MVFPSFYSGLVFPSFYSRFFGEFLRESKAEDVEKSLGGIIVSIKN